MKRNRAAAAITVLLLAAVLAFAWNRSRSPALASSEPQDSVYAMLNAARAGDVPRYLASYSGRMEVDLLETLRESGEPAFASYLRDSHAAVKGAAVSDPEPLPNGEQKVRVEYIYEDRNEVQFLYLEKRDGRWKIVRADLDARAPALIPYGTPMSRSHP